MRFKLDENLPIAVAALLHSAGHVVDTTSDEGLAGAEDAAVLAGAVRDRRALVTLDLDLADFRRFPPEATSGILVLRPRDQSVPQLLAALRAALQVLEREPLDGRLWIASPTRVRIRP